MHPIRPLRRPYRRAVLTNQPYTLHAMKTYRFLIKCTDGQMRFVFCRSLNTRDSQTASSVIATESRERAYVAYCAEQAERDLAYFTEHSRGAAVSIA